MKKKFLEMYEKATPTEKYLIKQNLILENNLKNALEGIAALQELAAQNYKYIANTYYRAAISSGVGISIAENEVDEKSKELQKELDKRSENCRKNNRDVTELLRKLS